MIEDIAVQALAENPQGELLEVRDIYKGKDGKAPKESWVVTSQVLLPVPEHITLRTNAPGDVWLWKPPSEELLEQYRKEYPTP